MRIREPPHATDLANEISGEGTSTGDEGTSTGNEGPSTNVRAWIGKLDYMAACI